MNGDAIAFGDRLAATVGGALGPDLVGLFFVGSMALGGYVPGESDIDVVGVVERALTSGEKRAIASAVVGLGVHCPARGLEFTLYRRAIASESPEGAGADFEVNANAGRRMPTAVHLDPSAEDAFWYVLDRAVAHRSGFSITGPPAATLFADVSRPVALRAMHDSMAWHRAHERATLYSVLNACRAWRFAETDVLGSKLDGASWARGRWPDAGVIDAAVALRHGQSASLDAVAVDELLGSVAEVLARVGGVRGSTSP